MPFNLHTRGSALRAPRRYAKRQGRCSNRNEPPICGTRHPRHFVANLRWQVCIVESAASSQSRGKTMRIHIPAQHPIFPASNLTTAALEALGRPTAGPALVTESGSGAPIPWHGRRKGARLGQHAALWAARRSLGVTEAALADGIGSGWAWKALGSPRVKGKASTLIL